MKLTMAYPTVGMSGTVKNSTLVFVHDKEGGVVFARARSRPNQPNTPEQIKTRSWQRRAAQHWGTLTNEERDAWNDFAAFISGEGRKRRGLDVCREAARMRLLLNLQPQREPPKCFYPERVRQVTVEPSSAPGELCLRILHVMDSVEGYAVLIRTTPQQEGAAMPREQQARSVCGPGPQSTRPLPRSGETVTFTDIRNPVNSGKTFGVTAMIIRTEDGLASAPAFFRVAMP